MKMKIRMKDDSLFLLFFKMILIYEQYERKIKKKKKL